MEGNNSRLIKNNNSTLNDITNKNSSTTLNEDIENIQNDNVMEFKIVLIGSTSVGKTSIFNRFINEDFSQNYKSTINVEFKIKYMKLDNNLFAKLTLWDTCGAEMFRAVTRQYYKNAHAIILVFDLTDQNSFNDLKDIWLNDVENYGEKNTLILIVGNKLDLIEERKVTESQAINFCRENGYKYTEASAKEGTNILKTFEELSFELATKYERQKEEEMKSQSKIIIENFEDKNIVISKNKKVGCC